MLNQNYIKARALQRGARMCGVHFLRSRQVADRIAASVYASLQAAGYSAEELSGKIEAGPSHWSGTFCVIVHRSTSLTHAYGGSTPDRAEGDVVFGALRSALKQGDLVTTWSPR